ncbi:vWA domain-containing protein [uncultured Tateyamaria sp.]|uniref:vWA domain-containing protein n=1 Tax=uncultured Tateyamaria sp. TaxID=455651 RepID=UPI00260BF9ED|nr:vWA domain-containing protein [uncultured Tateyamaria sp.]
MMYCFLRGFTSVVLLAFFATSSFAQCRGDLGFPVLTISEDAKIVDPTGNEIRSAKFLEPFQANGFVPRIDADGQQISDAIEISLGSGEIGLISLRDVLTFTGRSCTTERLLMRALPARDVGDGENNLQVKAFIGRRQLSDDTGSTNGVAFRAAPNANGTVLLQQPRYTLGYVFAQTYDEASRSDWYLITANGDVEFGLNNDGVIRSSLEENILGWVSDRDMVVWSQRQAVYPRSAEALGVISEDAELTEAGIASGAEVRWVDESSPNRERAILKYSVLRSLPDEGVYEVAYPQPAILGVGETLPSPGPPRAIVDDDIRVVLDLLRDEAKAVDVLFVLDNSESMGPYRTAVINGIADVANLPAADRDAMRIAVSMFGDVFNSSDAHTQWATLRGEADPLWADRMLGNVRFQYWLSDLSASGEYPTASFLQQRFGGTYDDPQDDRPESGLAALDLAMRTANWSEESVRIVVYIGDDQSRPIPGLNFDESQLQVATTLKSLNAVLLAINVAGTDPRDNEVWGNQVDAIRSVADDLPGRGGVYDRVFVAHDGQLAVTLEERKLQEKRSAQLAREAVTEGVGALFVAREFIEGPIDLERLCEIALANNVSCNVAKSLLESLVGDDLTAIEALEARTDLLKDGFYPIKDGALFVALSQQELNGLRNAISSACVGMQRPSGLRRDLEDMSEEITQAFLGETRGSKSDSNDETLPDFFARMTNLPAEYFGIFGERTLDDFIDFVQLTEDDPDQFRPIQRELCISSALMTRVLEGSWVTRDALETRFDEDFQAFDVVENRELKTFDWRWGVGGGLQIVYLPQDFFPASTE